jgi:hypothetical protein
VSLEINPQAPAVSFSEQCECGQCKSTTGTTRHSRYIQVMLDDWVVLGSDMAALMVASALAIVVAFVASGIGAAATKDDERARTEKKMEAIMVGA